MRSWSLTLVKAGAQAGEMIPLTPADALQAQLGLLRFCYVKVQFTGCQEPSRSNPMRSRREPCDVFI
jgi:hypothetical protein